MLQVIREHTQGIVVWFILGLVILSLGSFILSGYSPESEKNYVAKVNGETINQREYQQAYNQFQQRMGANFSSEPQFQNYVKQTIVNGLVDRELSHQMLKEAGFRVASSQLSKQIESTPYFHDADGKFSADTYQQVLQRIGMTSQAFEQQIGYDYSLQQLQQAVERSAFVTDYQVAEQQRLDNQQRDVGFSVITHANLLAAVPVSITEIKSYYTAHADQFMTTEAVKVQYVEMSVKDMAAAVVVNDAELKQYFDANKQMYSQDNFAAAEKKIKEIEQQLKKGESFAKLAEQYSQDTGSAQKGGDLGLFGHGAMVKPFDDAVFKLKVGEVSKPVQTEYGYHLIKLEEIKGEQRRARHILIKPVKVPADFTAAKEKIRRDLQQQRAEQAFFDKADKLDKLSYQNQDSLAPVAEQLGLQLHESDFFTRQGGPQQFHNPLVITAAFSDAVLKQGQNSEVIKLSGDHVMVLRLKDHQAAKQKPLEEVTAMIDAQLRREKAREQAYSTAKIVYQKLLAGENASAIVPAGNWQRVGFIDRTAAPAPADKKAVNPVSDEIRRLAFRIPSSSDPTKPSYSLERLANGDSVIIGVYAIRDATVTASTDAQAGLLRQMLQAQGQSDAQLLLTYQRKHSEILLNLPKSTEQ
jgi:peptidyl-prolyl cis-trans isomerase D